jgi:hypothetical protein
VECADGTINRVSAEPALTTANGQGGAGGSSSPNIACLEDDDCDAESACVAVALFRAGTTSLGTECVPASCRSAADCDSGECGVSINSVDGRVDLSCRSPDDECRTTSQCRNLWRDCDHDGLECLSSVPASGPPRPFRCSSVT